MGTVLAKFRQGNSPMTTNAIDYYREEGGDIIEHSWGMGGSSKKAVDSVPEEIAGYFKIDQFKGETP